MSYGLSINLTEVIWKRMVKQAFPNKKEYQVLFYIMLYYIILYFIILYYMRLHHLVPRSGIDRSTLIYFHIFPVVCWWFSSCMDWHICIVWFHLCIDFHIRASIKHCGGPRSSWAATRPRMARMTRMLYDLIVTSFENARLYLYVYFDCIAGSWWATSRRRMTRMTRMNRMTRMMTRITRITPRRRWHASPDLDGQSLLHWWLG